ncbi:MAG: TVP38/TMEM64 family protein [Chthoniobacterales bacterium]
MRSNRAYFFPPKGILKPLYMHHWAEFLNQSMEWIKHSGWLGVVWFIILYSLTCVFFLPGSFLTVGAGAVYGFWYGTLLVTVSSAVGAIVNFLTSRYLAHAFIARKLKQSQKMQALDKALEVKGWQIILLSRISPILPHSLVSYAAGLTSMSFWRYVMASWIGFIPISAAYSYAGAVLGTITRTKAGLRTHDPMVWIFYTLGSIATIVVTVMITRMATAALKQQVEAVEKTDLS